ncbi:MAG: TnpV protein [Acutalibacteraceae bacterium]|nr:TnpV protein [Acutalibacteraceae bacterium]
MKEIQYRQKGDYLVPDLKLPEQPEVSLGRYAEMRKKYLKEHRKILYTNLLTKGELTAHLAEIEERALEMEETIMKQMKVQEGLTEELKMNDMMKWVQGMNNLKNRVQEIVKAEVIYA